MNHSHSWGHELQGHHGVTPRDMIIGGILFTLGATAVICGVLNIVSIVKVQIFHNAFGALWICRSIGEIGSSSVHVFYSGPVTFIQLCDISPYFGIGAFTFGYFNSSVACLAHFQIAVNRWMAVWKPFQYASVFSRRRTTILIGVTWVVAFAIVSMYHAIPCQQVGFSPKKYEYVFVKCQSEPHLRSSLVGTLWNHICFGICILTTLVDATTFAKIAHISWFQKSSLASSPTFKLNKRFFLQTSIPNVFMVGAIYTICFFNNGQTSIHDAEKSIRGVFPIVVLQGSHIINAIVLFIFNREVRQYFVRIPNTNVYQINESLSAS
ncbi:hypothetical protein QR680_016899 [Steinernema hermaphroditum]|uniref:7TM GPCR serpentine receptor class x (Srx) domain-containing protein n=1 Tax=Steinernema hermaphroditum TaxID=289476 RepID=A0AA39LMQ1_9BILA|nr:hypothetical protein QR680_016899 [Steinernema hermaphroditum]